MVKFIRLFVVLLLVLFHGVNVYAASNNASLDVHPAKKIVPNKDCHKCHSDEDEKYETLDDDEETEVYIYVDENKFKDSVHGKQNCVGCHSNIEEKYHQERPEISVSCIKCHKEELKKQEDKTTSKYERLSVVMKQVDSYMGSVHARPSMEDQSKTNATCYDCHEPHNIGALGSEARSDHRLDNPQVCGKCHEKQKDEYSTSIHGKEVLENKNADAAVCSDCHTTHNIDSTEKDSTKLAVTKNCGSCHEKSLDTYISSYHGQVNQLGFTNTAKCYDCHDSHALKAVDDPTSSVHINNRLETCNNCHEDAPEGFLDFYAHGNADDYEKYPDIWIVTKFMNLLIVGVFLFFWTHVLLWFYREFKDRRAGKGYVAPAGEVSLYFRRFTLTWRIVHLLFAVSTMTLVLTGSTLLFSHTQWAVFVINFIGGPEVEAIIHRTAAVTWLSVFVVHFLVAIYTVIKERKTFTWFGPTSMVPNWKDLKDVKAMFSWFFGKSERPDFDRWSYWQKFDYWAPFWGAGIIGFSGMMLFAPEFTASFLPGYVFNIATIVHAEEALLATIFLFSVHFFNVHFRPDKFPMSNSIFTGLVPLDEYKHEHKMEYERLKASGELDKHIVERMPKGMQTGSNILTVLLIFFGLTLLTLVLIGYITGL